jgi:hypothetical protein
MIAHLKEQLSKTLSDAICIVSWRLAICICPATEAGRRSSGLVSRNASLSRRQSNYLCQFWNSLDAGSTSFFGHHGPSFLYTI